MSGTMAVDNIIPRANIAKHADRLGVEIKNITLSDDLPDDVILAFRQLLLEHKVIFFRDQGHLDDAQQQRFVLRLGSLTPNLIIADTTGGLAIRQELPDRACSLLNQMNDEHAHTAISVLRLAVVPSFGGDIAWSSRAAAYLDLPDSLRMLADNLWAVSFGVSDLTATEKATEPNKRPWLWRIDWNDIRNDTSDCSCSSRDRRSHALARSFHKELRRPAALSQPKTV